MKTWDEVVLTGAIASIGGNEAWAKLPPAFQKMVRDDADATLRGIIAGGLAIVPREATEEMVHAAWAAPTTQRAWLAALSAGEIAPKKGEG